MEQRSAGFFLVALSAQTPQDDKQVLAECAVPYLTWDTAGGLLGPLGQTLHEA